MYTWGLSPQALRLANQIKRRANAKSKIDDMQRREITKQLDSTGILFEARTKAGGGQDAGSVLQRYLNSRSKKRISPTILQTENKSPSEPILNENSEKMVKDSNENSIEEVKVESATSTDHDLEAIVQNGDPVVVKDFEHGLKSTDSGFNTPLKTYLSDSDLSNASNTTINPVTTSVVEPDPMEHMTPHLVDVSEVAGKILQVN